MNDKKALLYKIQVCSFNLDELTLFLDTHPKNKEAQELFVKYNKKLKELCEEYNSKYDIISTRYYDGGKWSWVESPWPWEMTEVQ